MPKIKLSVIAPVCNEESCILEFYKRLEPVMHNMGHDFEIIFVNDGSKDRSLAILKELRQNDPHVKILSFSRNFGHQIAVKAGIDAAQGDAVIMIDSDLQDPPEVIPQLVTKWQEGYDVVNTVHAERKGDSFLKRIAATLFYRLIKSISNVDLPLEAGDFKLISRAVASELKQLTERNLYLRGLTSWLGFKQGEIQIKRSPRFAGRTKYSTRKMLQLAWNGITHFSFLPLQISTYLGFATLLVSLTWIFRSLYVHFVLRITVPGWTSLMVAVLLLGSVQLITLGILGSYVAHNYDEVRSRPLYVIQEKEGF